MDPPASGRGARRPTPQGTRPGSGRGTRPQTTYGRDFVASTAMRGTGRPLSSGGDDARAMSVRPSRVHEDVDGNRRDDAEPAYTRQAWGVDDEIARSGGMRPLPSQLSTRNKRPVSAGRYSMYAGRPSASSVRPASAGRERNPPPRRGEPPPSPHMIVGDPRSRRASDFEVNGLSMAGTSMLRSGMVDAPVDRPLGSRTGPSNGLDLPDHDGLAGNGDMNGVDEAVGGDDPLRTAPAAVGARADGPMVRKYGLYGRGAASEDEGDAPRAGMRATGRGGGAMRGGGGRGASYYGVSRGAASDGGGVNGRRSSTPGNNGLGDADGPLRATVRPSSAGVRGRGRGAGASASSSDYTTPGAEPRSLPVRPGSGALGRGGRGGIGSTGGGLGLSGRFPRGLHDADEMGEPSLADRSFVELGTSVRGGRGGFGVGRGGPRYGPPPLRAMHPEDEEADYPEPMARSSMAPAPLERLNEAGVEVGVAEHANPRWRPTMEDAHVHEVALSGDPNCAYFGVYDGHGNRDAVDFIQKRLHKDVARELQEGAVTDQGVAAALTRAFKSTDNAMRPHVSPDSGATVVCALIRTLDGVRKLHVANAGDSRAVLGRVTSGRAEAVRLSRDHKCSDRQEAERIRKAGGFVTPGRMGDVPRVNGTLAVTRALGDHALKPAVSPEPHVTSRVIQSEDKFVIIACDGVWDVIDDRLSVDLIKSLGTAQAMAAKLVDSALKRGSTDNVTCMVVRINS